MFQVNYNEAQEKSFSPLKDGEYEVIITDVECKKTKNGDDMLSVTYTVRDDVKQEGQRSKVWDNVVFKDSVKWRYQLFFKALGLSDGTKLSTIQDVAQAVLHKSLKVRTEQEDYENKTYVRVKKFSPSSAPARNAQASSNPFDTADAKAVDEKDFNLPF